MIDNLKSQKGLASVIVILIVVGIAVVVGGIYWWQKSVAPTTPESATPTKVNESPTKTDELKVKSEKTVVTGTAGLNGYYPKFSNDGKRIVFRTLETMEKDAGLWIVNSDGTGLKRLTSELATGGGTYDFAWSPDDKFISYITTSYYPAPSAEELKVVEVETGAIKSVFQISNEDFMIRRQKWISQKEIAFVHLNEPNISNTSIKVVDVNLGKVIQPSKEITLYFWYIKGSSMVSPGQRSTIASVSTDGTVREITPDGAMSEPLVFPDGKRIAYATNNEMVIMNIDGSNPKVISSEITGGANPALSPGGDMFAYNKTRDDGLVLLESNIYIMNVDGTGEKKLTESGNKMAMQSSWSPNGSKIVISYYGTGEIGVIEIEKSK